MLDNAKTESVYLHSNTSLLSQLQLAFNCTNPYKYERIVKTCSTCEYIERYKLVLGPIIIKELHHDMIVFMLFTSVFCIYY